MVSTTSYLELELSADAAPGRTFGIFPLGVIDMEENIESEYGGGKWKQVLQQEGFMKLPNLFPEMESKFEHPTFQE